MFKYQLRPFARKSMGDSDPREPFRCPARECRSGQSGTDFGDIKHFYLHWYDTHRPTCPRTDCKFNKRGLSKDTQFYFVRHWSSHYPVLSNSKSKCEKCGQLFSNTSNRDRHARECNGISSTVASAAQRNNDQGHATNIIPIFGAATTSENASHHYLPLNPDDPVTLNPIQDGTQTALTRNFAWSPAYPAAASSPSPIDFSLTNNDWINTSTTMVVKSNSRPAQYLSPGLGPQLLGFDTAQVNVEQNSLEADHIQDEADFTIVDRPPDTSVLGTDLWDYEVANGMTHMSGIDTQLRSTTARPDSMGYLQSSMDLLPSSTPENRSSAVDFHAVDLGRRMIENAPMRIRREYRREWGGSEQRKRRSSSRHVIERRRVVIVRSSVSSRTEHREISCDKQVWIHKVVRKLTRKSCKIIETTGLIVNNVLNSKKKFPRMIDDDAPIWELCRTGQYDEVNRLLSQGFHTLVDVNRNGFTLLHIAAGSGQLEVSRLLIAKGADVEARDWTMSLTPFGLICGGWLYLRHVSVITTGSSSKDMTDVLCLLVDNGNDVCVEVEVDSSLWNLSQSMKIASAGGRGFMERELYHAFSWLLRRYWLDYTCEFILPDITLPSEVYITIQQSVKNLDTDVPWVQEIVNDQLFLPRDTEFLRRIWLSLIGRVTHDSAENLSSHFCVAYRIGFHYQARFKKREPISPLEIALQDFPNFARFHRLLLVSQTDLKAFIEVECTMPWCVYTKQTLERLFSVDAEAYQLLYPLFDRCRPCGCQVCDGYKFFWHRGILKWLDAIALVESGRTLASILVYPSEEEEQRLRLSWDYCGECLSGIHNHKDRDRCPGNRFSEDKGDSESSVNDGQASNSDPGMAEGERVHEIADSIPSDESSSEGDSSDEELSD